MPAYHCYDFNNEWFMIEMHLDINASKIDWQGFEVPEPGLDPMNWQAPYLEQYLNEDGTQRICDVCRKPENDLPSCRFIFYIFKVGMPLLHTPYGEFPLQAEGPVPERLQHAVEFEEPW